MERLLADATKLTGVKYDINNLNDVYEAIHVVQEELGITGTTAKESAETFTGSLASMKAAVSNLFGKMALGEDIKSELQAVIDTTSTFIFDNLIPMVGNALKALPEVVLTLIKVAGPKLLEGGGQIIQQLSDGIVRGIPLLVISLRYLIDRILNWAMENIPTFLMVGGQIISDIAEGIFTALPIFLAALEGIVTNIFNWVTENLPAFLEIGIQILTNIANGILEAIPSLITTAGNLINSFMIFFMDNFPVIMQGGADLVLALIDGIIENLPAIADSAIQTVSQWLDTIIENYPEYFKTGWGVVIEFVKGILERLPDVVEAAAKLMLDFVGMIIKKIPDVIKAVASMGNDIIKEVTGIDLWSAGSAIIEGFLSGLKSAFENVKNFIGGVADWIRNNKGPIEYDRRLLVPAGDAIMGGFDKSLRERFKSVQRTVSGMATGLRDSMNLNWQTAMMDTTVSSEGILSTRIIDGDFSTQFNPERDHETSEDDESGKTVVEVHVHAKLDKKEIVKEIAEPVKVEIEKINKRRERKRGDA